MREHGTAKENNCRSISDTDAKNKLALMGRSPLVGSLGGLPGRACPDPGALYGNGSLAVRGERP